MDAADELRQKLQAIESDKIAMRETHEAEVAANKSAIAELRQENKNMVARLRQLKNPGLRKPGERLGPEAIEQLDHSVCNLVKKHNQVRAKAEQREQELLSLQKKMHDLAVEQDWLKSNDEGDGPEAKKIRSLEAQIDKIMIKKRESVHIGNTYSQIIAKLKNDRLAFDNQLETLESAIRDRREELNRLEAVCGDAVRARDDARTKLMEADKTATAERRQREQEKRACAQAVEEQRRKYDAIERRQKANAFGARPAEDAEINASVQEKLLTSKDMLRSIQEATGVMDIHEVLQRFRSQNETEAKLKKLQAENAKTLVELKEKLAAATKTFEALKYSGEARNTSNQRMVTEFEQHLTAAQSVAKESETDVKRNSKLLIQVETGINHLHDKVETLKPVQFRAAASTTDKLLESKLRLQELLTELEQRKGELADVDVNEAPLVLPENNTRIAVPLTESAATKRKEEDEDSGDEDALDRDRIKKQSALLVESNMAAQQAGGRGKRR